MVVFTSCAVNGNARQHAVNGLHNGGIYKLHDETHDGFDAVNGLHNCGIYKSFGDGANKEEL